MVPSKWVVTMRVMNAQNATLHMIQQHHVTQLAAMQNRQPLSPGTTMITNQ
jgi:hypothetical protein